MFVDYLGTVCTVENAPGYHVGDKVSGRLIVDLPLAPPDLEPADARLGQYGAGHIATGQTDWITGFTEGAGAYFFDLGSVVGFVLEKLTVTRAAGACKP